MKNNTNWRSFGKTAVFIDAANIELSAKGHGWRVDYQKLYTWLHKTCEITYVGFYTARFDTTKHDKFLTLLKKTGYKLITKPLKLIGPSSSHIRKANFDVEIAVDAMDKLSDFETLLLFSGDSDFDYLIRKLQKQGKYIIVISMRYHIAKELVESANYYLDLKKIRAEIERK